MNTYFNILTGRLLGDLPILRPRPISRFESTDQTVNPRLEEASNYTPEPEAAEGTLDQRLGVEPLTHSKDSPSTFHSGAALEDRLSQVVQKLPVLAEPLSLQASNPIPPIDGSDSESLSTSQTIPQDDVNELPAIIPQNQPLQSSAQMPVAGRIKSQPNLQHSSAFASIELETVHPEDSANRSIQSRPLNRPLFAKIESASVATSPTRKYSPQASRFDEGDSLSQAVPEPVKLISPRERLLHHRPKEIPSGSVSSAFDQSPSLPPPIQVTIGRIEVKAVSPPPAPTRRPATPVAPALSLEEYLKQRGGTG